MEVSKSTKIITKALLIVPAPKTDTYMVVMINNHDDNVIKNDNNKRIFNLQKNTKLFTSCMVLNALPAFLFR